MNRLIVQRLNIPIEYNVYFTQNVFAPLNSCLEEAICYRNPRKVHRIFVILDGGLVRATEGLCGTISNYFEVRKKTLSLAGPILMVPGGEKVKNSDYWYRTIQRKLHRYHIDRHSFVVTVGGGAVLDMVGFAAATTHRGVRNIRVPTTLLSQADGGLGVKTGMNSFGVKNFIGTFTAPYAVVNDSDFLVSLPPRYLTSGKAEAVKVALIRDTDYFEWLERNATLLRSNKSSELQKLIRVSATIHLNHIALFGDPFESGSARPLDFGHWAAHKLESMTSYRLHHGEAVAIGIAIDSRYSTEIGLLSEQALDRILRLLDQLGLPSWHRALDLKEPNGRLKILRGLEEFKEHIGGDLTLTLLKRIGEGTEVGWVDHAALRRTLSWLKKRHASRCVST